MATAGQEVRGSRNLPNPTGGPAARASFCAGCHARATRCTPRHACSALAAFEALLLFVIVSAVLALVVGQAESARGRLRQNLASGHLSLLREALTVYYLDTGTFPPGSPDGAATDAFNALRSQPSPAAVLTNWPPAPDQPDAPLRDAWHSAYRYVAPQNDLSQQVATNGGWPFFLSAGPDGDFGGAAAPASEVDNRRTDELLAGRDR